MRTPSELPLSFSARAFAVKEARDAGVGRGRLLGRDIRRPFHGTRSTLASLAPSAKPHEIALRRLTEYAPLLSREQFFSSISAAIYWGLPLPWDLYDSPVHVATRWPNRAPRVGGAVGHALRRPSAIERDGFRVQTPADAWCELSAFLTLDELVAAGHALFYRQRKLASNAGLAGAIRKWGAKPGALTLREAFELIRENAESPKETEWRLILIRAGFPEPVVNFEVRGPDGKVIGIIDLAYPWAMTGLDYDGRHHAEGARQFARDGVRFNALQKAGWYDIRIMAGMTEAIVLEDLRQRLVARGWRGETSVPLLARSSQTGLLGGGEATM